MGKGETGCERGPLRLDAGSEPVVRDAIGASPGLSRHWAGVSEVRARRLLAAGERARVALQGFEGCGPTLVALRDTLDTAHAYTNARTGAERTMLAVALERDMMALSRRAVMLDPLDEVELIVTDLGLVEEWFTAPEGWDARQRWGNDHPHDHRSEFMMNALPPEARTVLDVASFSFNEEGVEVDEALVLRHRLLGAIDLLDKTFVPPSVQPLAEQVRASAARLLANTDAALRDAGERDWETRVACDADAVPMMVGTCALLAHLCETDAGVERLEQAAAAGEDCAAALEDVGVPRPDGALIPTLSREEFVSVLPCWADVEITAGQWMLWPRVAVLSPEHSTRICDPSADFAFYPTALHELAHASQSDVALASGDPVEQTLSEGHVEVLTDMAIGGLQERMSRRLGRPIAFSSNADGERPDREVTVELLALAGEGRPPGWWHDQVVALCEQEDLTQWFADQFFDGPASERRGAMCTAIERALTGQSRSLRDALREQRR